MLFISYKSTDRSVAEEVLRPDLIKHLSDVERTAVKKECLEDSQGTVRTLHSEPTSSYFRMGLDSAL